MAMPDITCIFAQKNRCNVSLNKSENMEKKERNISNSPRVMAELERIKSQKVRKFNKLGEWMHSGTPGFIDIIDMKAVMK